jgi:hypothetical protein
MDIGRVGHGTQLLEDDRLSLCSDSFQIQASVRPILANRAGDIQASERNRSLVSTKRGLLTLANLIETVVLWSGETYVERMSMWGCL